jgi:seryl-tRNA synthetase
VWPGSSRPSSNAVRRERLAGGKVFVLNGVLLRLSTMIDIRAARAEPDAYRAAIERKGAAEEFDELMEADRAWLALVPQADELRAKTKLKGKPTPEQIEELKGVKAELQRVEQELAAAESRRSDLLDRVPAPPDPSAPDGFTDDDAVELRRVGEPPAFSFEPRDHLELARIDTERGAKVSGSRFVYRIGAAARIELALYRFALDRLTAKGFATVLPPVLVREEAMYGTGFLPTDEVNLYRVERDELYLTGTSEVALAAMHSGEVLDADALPLRYAGYSTCFRREAGAAGKDTRGMFRVHQFDKVEMFVFTLPDRSAEAHDLLLATEEELVAELGIPYRVVNVAAGDLGASASKKYDIEAWFPGQGRYREITSTSNTTDYQTRRLDIRFRGDQGLEFVHTLNGTAVTGRAMLAVLENFQDEGGAVTVPDVLREFGAPARIEPGD